MLAKSLQILSKMGQLEFQHGSQEVTAKRGWHLLGPNFFRFHVFVVFCGLLGASWDHLGTNLWPFWDYFATIWDHFGAILCHIWTNVFSNFFVLFVFTSLTSLTAFIQGLADCAQRFKYNQMKCYMI